ncbi:hypothetical protein [Croceimicrobium sp.]|uniref:hypothetical protein n=1 Tax=Croceimicrobium sp. TaxID=2828340 RepID=UPI003BA987A1
MDLKMKNFLKKTFIGANVVVMSVFGGKALAQQQSAPNGDGQDLYALNEGVPETPSVTSSKTASFNENADTATANEMPNLKTAKGYNLRGQGHIAAVDFVLDSADAHPVIVGLEGSEMGQTFLMTKQAINNMDAAGIEDMLFVLSDLDPRADDKALEKIAFYSGESVLGILTKYSDGEWWYVEGKHDAESVRLPENTDIQAFIEGKISEASIKATGIRPTQSYTALDR